MAASLKEYKSKRNFSSTDEPAGKIAGRNEPELKFVVQHHIASRDHYDFRLEWDGVLKSWAVPKGPSCDSRDKRLAVQVEDHPLEYRNFEGTIPKGEYGGGTVMIWDEGEWLPKTDPEEGLTSGSLKFTLMGSRLKGAWALVRMKPKEGEKNVNWLLIKERDEFENACDLENSTTSVTTGRTMAEIGEGDEPRKKPVREGKARSNAALKKTSTAVKKKSGPERDPKSVNITNPDKVLYNESGISKGDVAAYYLKVAKRMMPCLENRILSVVRCPGGIETSCFYKKHPAGDKRGIIPFDVPVKDGKTEEYYYVDDAYGLMSEVQMNTIEFHTWGSRVETLESPDVMVFDLDPDEGLDLEKIRQGVKDLKSLLDELSLKSYLKTSGGKGYHVVIPFRAAAGWESFSAFARNIAKTMTAKWPERYTDNVRKNRRSNKIFIDWIRNGRGATSIAPYSVRAREGAPVSMPITWRELDAVTPDGISMEEAIKRLRRKDPWAGFFDNDQLLK